MSLSPPLFGGVGEVVNLLIVLIVIVLPFLKSIYDSIVEAQAKQKETKQIGDKLAEYLVNQQEKQDEVVLAEPVRQDIPSQDRFQSLPSQDKEKEKKKPKIRNKGKSLKPDLVDQTLARGLAVPTPTVAASSSIPQSPTPSRSQQVSPLAANILKMLQDPEGVRQAVVISEILGKPVGMKHEA